MVGLVAESGPQARLTQLLPSSTVAVVCSVNNGFGTIASAMPGGTLNVPAANSGGTREPLQYCDTTEGLATRLVGLVLASDALVISEYTGDKVRVVLLAVECLPGPASPRTPMSQ